MLSMVREFWVHAVVGCMEIRGVAPGDMADGRMSWRDQRTPVAVRAISALSLSLALLALSGSSSSAVPRRIGVVADSGFRPDANGFTFANYGATLANGTIPTNLTPAEMTALFGTAVCTDAATGTCDLIPQAQAWMNQMNKDIAGGHCFGFSVAADLVWQDQVDTTSFGAPTINGLTIDNNTSLQSTIAQGWAYQNLASVQANRITGTPDKVLQQLEKLLTPHPSDTYTIGIFKRDGTGGHAVTPYEVKYNGKGHYQVLVYDNNWPDQTRAIAFDTNNNTWSYSAASNPNNPSSLYEGDAKTKSLMLFPTSPGRGTQPCPFCGTVPSPGSPAGTTGAGGTEEIYLTGSSTNQSHVLVTDQAGRRLGNVNGRLVNEIPGSHDVLLTSDQDWNNKLQPIFYVPANGAYTITLEGTSPTVPDTESIGIIGPSWDMSVNDIAMHLGDKDTLTVDPNASKLTYQTTSAESPTIQAAVSDTQAHYAFVISGESIEPGSPIDLSIPPEGGTLITTKVGSTGLSSVNLQMTRSTPQGVQQFVHDAIPLADGETAELQFGNWTNPSQSIPLVTTHNGQQSTQTLTDQ